MVTYLSSLVQLCGREGGTLQTNIAGMCGEFWQCMGHSGFAPAHSSMCFLAVHCSGSRVLCRALSNVHFPSLSCSGSGSWVLFKGTDLVGHAFCALPRLEQLRRPGAWQAHCPRWAVHGLIISLVLETRFPRCALRALSQVCCVSPLGS